MTSKRHAEWDFNPAEPHIPRPYILAGEGQESIHKPLARDGFFDRARPLPFSVESEDVACVDPVDTGYFCQEFDGTAVKRSQIPGSCDQIEIL